MTIHQLRNEIEHIKKAVKPDPNHGILVIYNNELHDENHNIVPESVISIDGWNASKLSKAEIQALLDKPVMHICLPDNGRDRPAEDEDYD